MCRVARLLGMVGPVFAFLLTIYMGNPGSADKYNSWVKSILDAVIQPNEGSRVWLNNSCQLCLNPNIKLSQNQDFPYISMSFTSHK